VVRRGHEHRVDIFLVKQLAGIFQAYVHLAMGRLSLYAIPAKKAELGDKT
jgi:hypothetical protein